MTLINRIKKELGQEAERFAQLHGFALGYSADEREIYNGLPCYTLICLQCENIGRALRDTELPDEAIPRWEQSIREDWSEECPHLDAFTGGHAEQRRKDYAHSRTMASIVNSLRELSDNAPERLLVAILVHPDFYNDFLEVLKTRFAPHVVEGAVRMLAEPYFFGVPIYTASSVVVGKVRYLYKGDPYPAGTHLRTFSLI